jgi:predicted small secreted protein
MKYLLLIVVTLFSHSTYSQPNKKLHTITPKWKLGDIKNVVTRTSTKIYLKDSLFNNTEIKSNYTINVIDTVKNYTILYEASKNSLDIQSNSRNQKVDSVINIFTNIMETIDKETKSFQYEIIVDKKTGQAIKINNSKKLLELVEQVTVKMIDSFEDKFDKKTTHIDTVKKKMVAFFKQKEPKILETIINQFNYIMAAYALSFPYNSSIKEQTLIHDVNALGEFGDLEMPAILTISSKKSDKTLIVNTDTDYDKEFLLTQIKKKRKNMNKLTTADIFLSEKSETTFSTSSNWIVSQKSIVIFKLPEVKLITETNVDFQ